MFLKQIGQSVQSGIKRAIWCYAALIIFDATTPAFGHYLAVDKFAHCKQINTVFQPVIFILSKFYITVFVKAIFLFGGKHDII